MNAKAKRPALFSFLLRPQEALAKQWHIVGLSRNVVLIIVVQEEDGEETTRNGNLIHDEHP